MGFFSILSDISRNKSNFKQWEEQERDNDAKRKALYKKGVGKERIEEAKKRGDVIIDVITQMDQHSENFAEDIEQVTQPLTSLALMGGMFGGLFGGGYYFYKTTKKGFKNFSDIKEQLDKEVGKNINNVLKEKELTKEEIKKLDSIKWNWNKKFFDEKHLETYKPYLSEETLKEIKNTHIPSYQKFLKSAKRHGAIAGAIAIATPIIAYTLTTLGTTKMQLDGSRIARWQSRNQLSDARNFVVFTPEQIAEAEEEVKKNQKPLTFREKLFGKKDKSQAGFWKNWLKFFTDRKAYNTWKAQDSDDSKKITRTLTPQEEQEAKLDQELIQRITKKINNRAEEYSEDMETAAAVILNLPIVTGPLIGVPLAWIFEKTGAAKRLSDSIFNKNAPKGYKEFLQQQTAGAKKGKIRRFIDFFKSQDKLNELIREEQTTLKITDKAGEALKEVKDAHPYKTFWRKAKIIATQTPAMRRLTSIGFVFAGTTIVTAYLGLKLQKNAARAGRYTAREEFKDNPQEFLSYTDEEMQQVKDIKGKKPTLAENFKSWIFFLPRCIKNVYKYENYKKTTYQKQKDIRERLVKSAKISDKQLLEAKNLQRKLFNTFEKVDEKSQAYSENMEAANEIATPFIYIGGYALTAAPFLAILAGVAKGKISVAKLGEWTTGLLAKVGGSKWGQKVQKESVQSLASTIEKMPDEPFNFEKLAELIGIPKDMFSVMSQKFDWKNKTIRELIAEIIEKEQPKAQELFSKKLSALIQENGTTSEKVVEKLKEAKISNILNLDNILPKESSPAIKWFDKIGISQKVSQWKDKSLYDILLKKGFVTTEGTIKPEYTNKTIGELLADVVGIKPENINLDAKVGDIIKTESSKLAGIAKEAIGSCLPTTEQTFRWLRGAVEIAPESTIQATLGKLSGKELGSLKMGTIDRQYVIRMLNRLETVVNKSANSGLKEEVGKLMQTMMQNPQKTLNLLVNHPEKLMNAFKSETLVATLAAAGISWVAFTTILTYCLASYFASMQKDAGKLGVMKAIEDLKDYRYYADEIPENATPKEVAAATPVKQEKQKTSIDNDSWQKLINSKPV